MYLTRLGDTWNRLGERDPMWAVLMDPDRVGNRWDQREFFDTGLFDVAHTLHAIRELQHDSA